MKSILLWALLFVVWFLVHTLLIVVVISGLSIPTNDNPDSKTSTQVPTDGKERKFYNDVNQNPKMPNARAQSANRSNGDRLRFVPRGSNQENFEKSAPNSIEPKKMRRLSKVLATMFERHFRPEDNYFGFNVTASDSLPIDRDVPDNRSPECRNTTYDYSTFPSVSIVTPLHNEALTPLVRHVVAILTRTPDVLLEEIILVDDNSTFSYLGDDLDDLFQELDPRIQIIRNEDREGLVMSRIHGADVAKSEVVVFLDAHMEVGHDWLEPLLERLMRQSEIVVQPDIAEINGQTLEFISHEEPLFRGGFGWDMRYAWYFLPPYLRQIRSSPTDPIPTPVLIGCAIAVRKEYFNAIGGFDPGLQIWGGEHFDLSFRVWTSGGKVETVPCSKVGHIFKENKYGYGSKGKSYILYKNLMRVAEVWLDEYKDIAYAAVRSQHGVHPKFSPQEQASIEERRQLNRKLNCKNFTWFLKHITPEVKIPSREAVWFGEITNLKSKHCFKVTSDDYIEVTDTCFKFRILPENTFTIDKWGRLLYESRCVDFDKQTMYLKLVECLRKDQGVTEGKWTMSPEGELVFINPRQKLCATHVTSQTEPHYGKQMVQAWSCDSSNEYQKWQFMYHLVF